MDPHTQPHDIRQCGAAQVATIPAHPTPRQVDGVHCCRRSGAPAAISLCHTNPPELSLLLVDGLSKTRYLVIYSMYMVSFVRSSSIVFALIRQVRLAIAIHLSHRTSDATLLLVMPANHIEFVGGW